MREAAGGELIVQVDEISADKLVSKMIQSPDTCKADVNFFKYVMRRKVEAEWICEGQPIQQVDIAPNYE